MKKKREYPPVIFSQKDAKEVLERMMIASPYFHFCGDCLKKNQIAMNKLMRLVVEEKVEK